MRKLPPTSPFAEFILSARLKRGLAAKTVAIDAGIGVSTLWSWENGTPDTPRLCEFARWARALQLSGAELRSAVYLLATADPAAEPGPLIKLMEAS